MKKLIWTLCIAAALVACEKNNPTTPQDDTEKQDTTQKSDSTLIPDTTQLPEYDESLILGADLSLLPRYEQAKAVYRDTLGKTVEPLALFADQKFNCVRVRLFVNPDTKSDSCQDLAYVRAFAQQIKAAGFKFMLDFHYSDGWADPLKQTKPAAWKDLTFDELTAKIYDYTKEVLTTLNADGCTPDYIQTGNEITGGMLWEDGRIGNMSNFCTLLKSAIKACNECCPEAKIVLHIERPQKTDRVVWFYQSMNDNSVAYDIIGLSYYPHWHGNLTMLSTTLKKLETTFTDKSVMIVEYGYYNNWYPSDATYNYTATYPATPAGQAKMTQELVATLCQFKQVNGLFYWFPEENEAKWTGIIDGWTNRGLFSNSNGRALPALYTLKNFRVKE